MRYKVEFQMDVFGDRDPREWAWEDLLDITDDTDTLIPGSITITRIKPEFEQGDVVKWEPTTDEFTVEVIRQLVPGVDALDPEVGPMYLIAVHAYADEMTLREAVK